MKLALLGAGAWGTALAISLSRDHQVTLWTRDSAQAEKIRDSRTNARYLPGYAIPANVTCESDLAASIATADIIIAVVPTSSLRDVTKQITRAG